MRGVSAFQGEELEEVLAKLGEHSHYLTDGCVIWGLAPDRHGYGALRYGPPGHRRVTGVHRASWIASRGPLASGLVIDHLCGRKACVNPDHLEPVTNAENIRRAFARGEARGRPRIPGGTATSCGRHGREDGTPEVSPKGYATWRCRVCARERGQRYRDRQRASLPG